MPEKEKPIEIPIKWDDIENVPTIYANEMIISHTGGEFYLIFGEMQPPIGYDKDNLPESIKVNPIVKVAITHKNMLKFAEVIQNNIETFKTKISFIDEDESE